jgi:hypothetical protein
MKKYEDVYRAIVDYLRNELQVPPHIVINPNSSISRSMGIDTDDLTFLLIPYLQKKFQRKLGNKQWSQLETVEQIARAFADE